MLFQCLVWYGKDNDSQRDCKGIGQKGKYVVLWQNFFIITIENFAYIIPHHFFHDYCFLFRDPFLYLSFFFNFPTLSPSSPPLFLTAAAFLFLFPNCICFQPLPHYLYLLVVLFSFRLICFPIFYNNSLFLTLFFCALFMPPSRLSYFYFLSLSPPPPSYPSFFPSLLLPSSPLL